MANAEKKSLEAPYDHGTFDTSRVEVVNIGGGTVGRFKFEHGWKWSDYVMPIAGIELCQSAHFAYQTTGPLHMAMADRSELEVGAGGCFDHTSGHNASVVGAETVTGIDWSGLADYANA